MDKIEVQIRLDRIATQIVWLVRDQEELQALRTAIGRGELGRARIVAERRVEHEAEVVA